MLDKMIDSVKGFLPNLIWFAVAGAVASIVMQLHAGTGFDIMTVIAVAVTAAVGALMTNLVISAMDNGS
jgi:uncharacterized membrane protein YeaQ/YmgE (transglycosylase-associated protein family)